MTSLLARWAIAVAVCLATAGASAEPYRIPKETPRAVAGEILIRLTRGPEKEFQFAAATKLSQSIGATVVATFPEAGVQRWRVSPDLVEKTLSRLNEERKLVEVSDRNHYIYAAAVEKPSDPQFDEQWALHT